MASPPDVAMMDVVDDASVMPSLDPPIAGAEGGVSLGEGSLFVSLSPALTETDDVLTATIVRCSSRSIYILYLIIYLYLLIGDAMIGRLWGHSLGLMTSCCLALLLPLSPLLLLPPQQM